jgi:hypothetical protein
MGAALEQAALGLEAGELPIGSVVAADGEIVARSHWRAADGLLRIPSSSRCSARTAAVSSS